MFLEILAQAFIDPFLTLLLENPFEQFEESMRKSRLPKWVRVLLAVLLTVAFIGTALLVVCGSIFIAMNHSNSEKTAGIIMLSVGLALFVAYIVFTIIRQSREKRRRKKMIAREYSFRSVINMRVHVIIDRPLGTTHPKHNDIVYGVNYGYVAEYMGGDGEPQDAYVLGVDTPISQFDGKVIAVIHRLNDNEDKWVVAPSGYEISDKEIMQKVEFQEKYFMSIVRRY